jgi:multidrug efflux pump subunit AcrA (membrane-fusion protein)
VVNFYRKWWMGLIFLVVVVALYFGYRANRNFLKHYPRVQAAFVSRNDLSEDIEVAGKVIAEEIRDLYVGMDAKVQTVIAKEGDPVHQGQALLRFDSDAKKLELVQCQADILRLEQELAVQKSAGYSAKGLKLSETNLEVLYLRKSILEKEIRELTVTAPIQGRISLLIPKPGDKIGSGTRIGQVIDETKLFIEAEVPADDGMKIRTGDPAEVSFGTITTPYRAEVVRILPPVRNPDNSYSNLRIRLRVTETGVVLIPGSSLRVRVRIGRAKLAVTAPVESIHEELTVVRGDREYFAVRPATGTKRKYIFVLRDCSETLGPAKEKERRWMIRDNVYQARKVYVETGVSGVDRIEILKGVRPFEQVIIYSDRDVHDYDRVIVINRDESYKQPISAGDGN